MDAIGTGIEMKDYAEELRQRRAAIRERLRILSAPVEGCGGGCSSCHTTCPTEAPMSVSALSEAYEID
jgi:hypothetical protein